MFLPLFVANGQYFENKNGGVYSAGPNGTIKMLGTSSRNGAFVGSDADRLGSSNVNRVPGTVVWAKEGDQTANYISRGSVYFGGVVPMATLDSIATTVVESLLAGDMWYVNLGGAGTGVKTFFTGTNTYVSNIFNKYGVTTTTILHECSSNFHYDGTAAQKVLPTFALSTSDNFYAGLYIDNTSSDGVEVGVGLTIGDSTYGSGKIVGTYAASLEVAENAKLISNTSITNEPFSVGSNSSCHHDHSVINSNATFVMGANRNNFVFGGNGGATLGANDYLMVNEGALISQTGAGEGFTFADNTTVQYDGSYSGENIFITTCDNSYFNVFFDNNTKINTETDVYIRNTGLVLGNVMFANAGLNFVNPNAGPVFVSSLSSSSITGNHIVLPWDGASFYDPSTQVMGCTDGIYGWISRSGAGLVPNKEYYYNNAGTKIAVQLGTYNSASGGSWNDVMDATAWSNYVSSNDICSIYSQENGATSTAVVDAEPNPQGNPQKAYEFSFFNSPNAQPTNSEYPDYYDINTHGTGVGQVIFEGAALTSGYIDRIQKVNFGVGVRGIRSIQLGFAESEFKENNTSLNAARWANNKLHGFEGYGSLSGGWGKQILIGYNATQMTSTQSGLEYYRPYAGAKQQWYGDTRNTSNVTASGSCNRYAYVMRNEYITLAHLGSDIAAPGTANGLYRMSQILFTEEAIIIASIRNGRWSDPATWNTYTTPSPGDAVTINTIVYTGLWQPETLSTTGDNILFSSGLTAAMRNWAINEYDLEGVKDSVYYSDDNVTRYYKIADCITINNKADAVESLESLGVPITGDSPSEKQEQIYPALIFGNAEVAGATGNANDNDNMDYSKTLAVRIIVNHNGTERPAMADIANATFSNLNGYTSLVNNMAAEGLIIMAGRATTGTPYSSPAPFSDGFTQPLGPIVNTGNYVQSGAIFLGSIFEIGGNVVGTAPTNP